MKEITLELTIDAIGFEGISIAHKDGEVYFVKGGLPGDRVIAKIRKKNKKYTECSIVEMIEASSYRIPNFCNYYGACGGCSWQCLDYNQQLHWKKQHTIDAYKRIGNININCYHDTIPAIKRIRYRNKMDFSFSAARWLTTNEIESGEQFNTHFAFGLHIPGKYDKVLDIEECKIQPDLWNDIMNSIRTKALELNVSAFDYYHSKGLLKGVCFRHSILNDETMLILITTNISNENEHVFLNWFRYELMKEYQSIVSITHAINVNNGVNNGEVQFIEGKEYISEQILGIEYRISPFSFFQTNTNQLDTFIAKILEYANISDESIVWDLYCGTGSITLPASKYCKEIYGIEVVESAISDAKQNAKDNGITNAKFFATDLHNSKKSEPIISVLPKPNLIIIDPPRSGLHSSVVKLILDVNPPNLVYVSCNPTTQARDLVLLIDKYKIVEVQPIDMFPNTYHIEVVTKLVAK